MVVSAKPNEHVGPSLLQPRRTTSERPERVLKPLRRAFTRRLLTSAFAAGLFLVPTPAGAQTTEGIIQKDPIPTAVWDKLKASGVDIADPTLRAAAEKLIKRSGDINDPMAQAVVEPILCNFLLVLQSRRPGFVAATKPQVDAPAMPTINPEPAVSSEDLKLPTYDKYCRFSVDAVDYDSGIPAGLKVYSIMHEAGLGKADWHILLIDNLNVPEEGYAAWCKKANFTLSNIEPLVQKLVHENPTTRGLVPFGKERMSDEVVRGIPGSREIIGKCIDYVKVQMPELSDCQATLLATAGLLGTKVAPLSAYTKEDQAFFAYREQWHRAWDNLVKNGNPTLDELAERCAELHQRTLDSHLAQRMTERALEARLVQTVKLFPELGKLDMLNAVLCIDIRNANGYYNIPKKRDIDMTNVRNLRQAPTLMAMGILSDNSLVAKVLEQAVDRPLTRRESYLMALGMGPLGEYIRAEQLQDFYNPSALFQGPLYRAMGNDDNLAVSRAMALTEEQLLKLAKDSTQKSSRLDRAAFLVNGSLYFGQEVTHVKGNELVNE